MTKQSFKPIDPKPDFPKLEEDVLKFWEDNQIFQKSLEQTQNGKPYTFYDGPPFATGLPHYGHILASTVKDLFPRYQTMNGRYVRRRWGWDCHGLPIEELVERQLGISGKKDIEKLGIKKFNETCRNMVLQFADEWKKTIRRIARWTEFDDSYKTMDRDYMESVWWGFKQIYDKGLIYEGRRVLLYCPRCETPISNFEVAMDNSYKEVTEEAVTAKFKVKGQENTYLVAWTTTPWTLPGNVALAVGPDIDYVKVEQDGAFYIRAKKEGDSGDVIKGKDLVGLEYEALYDMPELKSDKSYKVYPADFVTTEDGTGIVHTAVVYGEDDYNLGVKVGLPIVPMLDEKGIFNDKAPELIRGKYFKDAEKLIKKDLDTRGLLFARQQNQHSYPHCWRCGTMLYYNAIPAWFMNIQKVKNGLLETNEKEINWYPDHLKHGRYQKSVEAAPDWNISRNRYWGNPIPVWKCEDGHNTVVGSIKELGLGKNTFYFTRHGEAESNVKKIVHSSLSNDDKGLTENGKARVLKEAAHIKSIGGIDMIVASPFKRTKQTAEILSQALGVEVIFDDRLVELQCGTYDGRSYEDFDRDYPFHTRWTKMPPGAETWEQAKDRLMEAISDLNSKHQGKKILIVSHGDPLRALQKSFGSERPYPRKGESFEMDVSIADLHRPYIDEIVLNCKARLPDGQECGKDAHRITEIFDSWVEAGSMPFAEYHYPFDQKEVFESRSPAQFVAEYIAQTRAWFYVMHVISFNLFGKAPFENVVTTGTILAEDGSKMSKSKNNYPDPWGVIEKYGVDALRFYLMNSSVMNADNLNFSEKDLSTTYRKNILILWNVYNYFVTYANETGWNRPTGSFKFRIIDRWLECREYELTTEVTKYLDNYDTVRATKTIEKFIDDLSTWYLRRNRGRKDPEFFYTLSGALKVLANTMAPITPYLSELIYQNLKGDEKALSVHLEKWYGKISPVKDQHILDQMQFVRDLVVQGHSLRKSSNIKLRQPLNSFMYQAKEQLPKEFEEILADELNVKTVKFGDKLEFDLNLTPELKKEGLAAELERSVQDMRKKSGLKVGEVVNLTYDTDDGELTVAFDLFDRKKTYVKEIQKGPGGEEFEIDGKKITIKLG